MADPGFCMGRWPNGLKKIQGAQHREIFSSPSRGGLGACLQKILKIECLRLAKNAFLAIERSQISSKISAVCIALSIIIGIFLAKKHFFREFWGGG